MPFVKAMAARNSLTSHCWPKTPAIRSSSTGLTDEMLEAMIASLDGNVEKPSKAIRN
jgi:hypothetical protein